MSTVEPAVVAMREKAAVGPANGGGNGRPIIIQATSGWNALNLFELWEHRDLIYFFLWRDRKVRYKQTVLGVLWVVLQPLAAMLIFTVFFGKLAKVPSDGIPYPLFAYTALVPWLFFSSGLSRGAVSLVGNANMIKKVYFPRLIVPISAVASGLIDLLLSFVMLLAMMGYYRIAPTTNLLWLPLFLLLAFVTCLGITLWLAALAVEYRDINHVVPFLVQLWLFATPVVYPSSLVPYRWRTLYASNPMVGVVEGFRWALLGRGAPPNRLFLVSAVVATAVLVAGLFYFRRKERNFADVV
jgi:lipopolysaccharide transport system permease protein